MRAIIFFVSIFISTSVFAEDLILNENSFGTLILNKETKISLEILKNNFPQYTFTHDIGQGDSPDFHYFEAKDKKSNTIFSISSFIENENDHNNKLVKIDVLEIYTPEIKDQYGISNGMKYSEIIKIRGSKLEFGANHHDNHVGSKNIWYALSSQAVSESRGGYLSPESITLKEIEKANPEVVTISWPIPRW